MRKEDLEDYNEWESIRRDAQDLKDHGFLSRLFAWIVSIAERNQKEILDEKRNRNNRRGIAS